MGQITEETVLVATSNAISTDLEGEAVILDTDAGEYYGLNEVGARVWTLLQDPLTFEEVIEALMQEYSVEREKCEREVQSLLKTMIENGLIKTKTKHASSS